MWGMNKYFLQNLKTQFYLSSLGNTFQSSALVQADNRSQLLPTGPMSSDTQAFLTRGAPAYAVHRDGSQDLGSIRIVAFSDKTAFTQELRRDGEGPILIVQIKSLELFGSQAGVYVKRKPWAELTDKYDTVIIGVWNSTLGLAFCLGSWTKSLMQCASNYGASAGVRKLTLHDSGDELCVPYPWAMELVWKQWDPTIQVPDASLLPHVVSRYKDNEQIRLSRLRGASSVPLASEPLPDHDGLLFQIMGRSSKPNSRDHVPQGVVWKSCAQFVRFPTLYHLFVFVKEAAPVNRTLATTVLEGRPCALYIDVDIKLHRPTAELTMVPLVRLLEVAVSGPRDKSDVGPVRRLATACLHAWLRSRAHMFVGAQTTFLRNLAQVLLMLLATHVASAYPRNRQLRVQRWMATEASRSSKLSMHVYVMQEIMQDTDAMRALMKQFVASAAQQTSSVIEGAGDLERPLGTPQTPKEIAESQLAVLGLSASGDGHSSSSAVNAVFASWDNLLKPHFLETMPNDCALFWRRYASGRLPNLFSLPRGWGAFVEPLRILAATNALDLAVYTKGRKFVMPLNRKPAWAVDNCFRWIAGNTAHEPSLLEQLTAGLISQQETSANGGSIALLFARGAPTEAKQQGGKRQVRGTSRLRATRADHKGAMNNKEPVHAIHQRSIKELAAPLTRVPLRVDQVVGEDRWAGQAWWTSLPRIRRNQPSFAGGECVMSVLLLQASSFLVPLIQQATVHETGWPAVRHSQPTCFEAAVGYENTPALGAILHACWIWSILLPWVQWTHCPMTSNRVTASRNKVSNMLFLSLEAVRHNVDHCDESAASLMYQSGWEQTSSCPAFIGLLIGAATGAVVWRRRILDPATKAAVTADVKLNGSDPHVALYKEHVYVRADDPALVRAIAVAGVERQSSLWRAGSDMHFAGRARRSFPAKSTPAAHAWVSNLYSYMMATTSMPLGRPRVPSTCKSCDDSVSVRQSRLSRSTTWALDDMSEDRGQHSGSTLETTASEFKLLSELTSDAFRRRLPPCMLSIFEQMTDSRPQQHLKDPQRVLMFSTMSRMGFSAQTQCDLASVNTPTHMHKSLFQVIANLSTKKYIWTCKKAGEADIEDASACVFKWSPAKRAPFLASQATLWGKSAVPVQYTDAGEQGNPCATCNAWMAYITDGTTNQTPFASALGCASKLLTGAKRRVNKRPRPSVQITAV